jgi:hypothetical protein
MECVFEQSIRARVCLSARTRIFQSQRPLPRYLDVFSNATWANEGCAQRSSKTDVNERRQTLPLTARF